MPIQLQNEQELIYTIDNFKTMNRKVKEELLPPDTAYNCQNLRYDTIKGMIYKRPSRRKYNSTTLGADPITSQVRYYKNSNNTKKYVIATSSFLKTGTDATGAFSNIKTGLTSNKRFSFITFKDLLYCFNGEDNNQVYDGTNNCEDMGVPVPSAPTLVLAGAGSLTGDYYYKVTYMIDGYQEGSASVASSVISPSSQKITVTIPTSANTRITHRKIYRTKAGTGTYYLLATITDNTTTTYGDNAPDGSLSATQAPTDYGAPASYRYGILHKSRVFLARNSTHKSRIIFSDIRSGTSYPDVFPADNVLDIAKDDGDEITGIIEDHVGNLVVFKNNSVRIIYTDGDSPQGWSIGRPITNFGNVAPYFLIKTPIGALYMTRFGKDKNRLMLWSGLGVKHILEEVDPLLDNIDPAGLSNTVGHFHNGKIYISYTDTSEFPDIAIDDYTTLLLHFNGTDGATTFIDSSQSAKTVTASGNAQIDTGQKKFNTASGLFDGTGDYVSLADHADWTLGTGNFTIDFWVRLANMDNNCHILQQKVDGDNTSYVMITSAGSLYAIFSRSGGLQLSGYTAAGLFSINTWYHIAIVRDGLNSLKIFIDGVSQSLTTDYSLDDITDLSAILTVGGDDDGANSVNGWIDELRISKGIARWTSNFIPPTVEYGYGYNNKLLLIDAETLSMIDIDDKAIDSFSSWNSGTDVGELYTGTSNVDGFCYEEETDTNASESTIEIEYKWGKLTLDQPRFKKRLRQVKIEFTRSVASGTLSYFYSLDGGSETQVDIAFSTYASQGYYIYYFPLSAFCYYIQPRLYSNSDISSLGIKRLTYIYSLEPYLPSG